MCQGNTAEILIQCFKIELEAFDFVECFHCDFDQVYQGTYRVSFENIDNFIENNLEKVLELFLQNPHYISQQLYYSFTI